MIELKDSRKNVKIDDRLHLVLKAWCVPRRMKVKDAIELAVRKLLNISGEEDERL